MIFFSTGFALIPRMTQNREKPRNSAFPRNSLTPEKLQLNGMKKSIKNCSYLSYTSVSSIEYRLVHFEQFLQEVTKSDSIDSWYQHLKEWNFLVVFEHWNDALPAVHSLHVKINITTPQVSNTRQLQLKRLTVLCLFCQIYKINVAKYDGEFLCF